jgi:selenoprotein W-related protein
MGGRETAKVGCGTHDGFFSCATRSRFQITGTTMSEHRIEIHYCRQCRWLLRAAWMAQELMLTFEEDLAEVALRPGTGGIFEVRLDGEILWSRKEKGRFPEIRELKQLVRDRVAPERDLGHSERPVSAG